jgi:hypothetical protein
MPAREARIRALKKASIIASQFRGNRVNPNSAKALPDYVMAVRMHPLQTTMILSRRALDVRIAFRLALSYPRIVLRLNREWTCSLF